MIRLTRPVRAPGGHARLVPAHAVRRAARAALPRRVRRFVLDALGARRRPAAPSCEVDRLRLIGPIVVVVYAMCAREDEAAAQVNARAAGHEVYRHSGENAQKTPAGPRRINKKSYVAEG